ncbi:MAG TPA: penicillin-binding transpeptidase domain-containing protein [Thermoleophilaceae bacterium]|nr:penicillin-binding transpeptidase domain-containing protein [Thermoleophilaceae bacterium]
MIGLSGERRRRLTHRALPALGGLALVAGGAGMVVGSQAQSGSQRTAAEFTQAWERGDYGAMYGMLDDASREVHSREEFRAAYRDAAATATATGIRAGDPEGERNGSIAVPVEVKTRVFGTLRANLRLPVHDEEVTWGPLLAFPGLRRGEALARESQPPERATLLSRNEKVLAEGPADARSSPLEAVAGSIAGTLMHEETRAERRALWARGFPRDWPTGQNGLEHAFEDRLAGRPGGRLLAGDRVIAEARPRPAPPVRTTLDTRLQEAAVTALAGRFGGIAALDPRNGEIRALAGLAFSAPQPPGSTFKIVTTTAALEEDLVKPSTEFPVETFALIDGVELQNANGESCGGSFRNSFAHSCNSVFGPLGVEVGSEALVEASERFGWNQEPTVAGEVPSTLPPSDEIESDLEIASTAIGQFRTLATPLVMASVAQTIAAGGVRFLPTLALGERTDRVRVTSKEIAQTIQSLMVDVVDYGTGTAAALPGVKVAGKTGTAELEDTRDPETGETAASDPSNTDAWFTAYAPAKKPELAVAVMLVRAGSGGATAAPAARVVLDAAL